MDGGGLGLEDLWGGGWCVVIAKMGDGGLELEVGREGRDCVNVAGSGWYGWCVE